MNGKYDILKVLYKTFHRFSSDSTSDTIVTRSEVQDRLNIHVQNVQLSISQSLASARESGGVRGKRLPIVGNLKHTF